MDVHFDWPDLFVDQASYDGLLEFSHSTASLSCALEFFLRASSQGDSDHWSLVNSDSFRDHHFLRKVGKQSCLCQSKSAGDADFFKKITLGVSRRCTIESSKIVKSVPTTRNMKQSQRTT